MTKQRRQAIRAVEFAQDDLMWKVRYLVEAKPGSATEAGLIPEVREAFIGLSKAIAIAAKGRP